jgi:ribosome-associated translation inhibitor RaiA
LFQVDKVPNYFEFTLNWIKFKNAKITENFEKCVNTALEKFTEKFPTVDNNLPTIFSVQSTSNKPVSKCNQQ